MKVPKASPGYSGGKLRGKSKAEGGREGEEEEEELRRLENEVMNVILAKEQREMDVVEGDAWKAATEARSSEAKMGPSGEFGFGVNRKDSLEETRRHMGQSWDCSQMEDESEERCDGLARG